MKLLTRQESIYRISRLASEGTPFVFLISFSGEHNVVLKDTETCRNGFFLEMPGKVNHSFPPHPAGPFRFKKFPVKLEQYREAFTMVMEQILYGNSFLLNLTFPTHVETSLSLDQIFSGSRTPFKLFIKDRLVVFSPERFVRIRGNIISSNPMKGTIDAAIPHAARLLQSDIKEDAEHNTIVDLIRNDLSTISREVRVKRFKYIEKLRTHQGELLQMSSEIEGKLQEGYRNRLGEILFSLLPAGSISGAPKKKTLEIIRKAETCPRGFYTGIFGYCDEEILDSAVAIRYIEKLEGKFISRSGGGITCRSNCEKEYEEMISKVYVPVY